MSGKKTMTVAIYSSKYNSTSVNEVVEWIEEHKDYIRISEPQTVTFTPLDHEVVLKLRLDALDREIESVRATAQATVDDLEDQKQRLLAITHEVY